VGVLITCSQLSQVFSHMKHSLMLLEHALLQLSPTGGQINNPFVSFVCSSPISKDGSGVDQSLQAVHPHQDLTTVPLPSMVASPWSYLAAMMETLVTTMWSY
jgi:hypothetical protein